MGAASGIMSGNPAQRTFHNGKLVRYAYPKLQFQGRDAKGLKSLP
jgi:hypothetical protein